MQTDIDLSLGQLYRDLENGLTRYKSEDRGWGSVEEKYGMARREAEIIFSHKLLKDKKPFTIRFRLINDVDTKLNTNSFLGDHLPVSSNDLISEQKVSQSKFVEDFPVPQEEQKSLIDLL